MVNFSCRHIAVLLCMRLWLHKRTDIHLLTHRLVSVAAAEPVHSTVMHILAN